MYHYIVCITDTGVSMYKYKGGKSSSSSVITECCLREEDNIDNIEEVNFQDTIVTGTYMINSAQPLSYEDIQNDLLSIVDCLNKLQKQYMQLRDYRLPCSVRTNNGLSPTISSDTKIAREELSNKMWESMMCWSGIGEQKVGGSHHWIDNYTCIQGVMYWYSKIKGIEVYEVHSTDDMSEFVISSIYQYQMDLRLGYNYCVFRKETSRLARIIYRET